MSEASGTSGASGRRPNHGRVGTVVNGKWTIDARIGSGGMATVYAATHRNGHRAALKMLHAQLSRDEPTRARFLREGYVANAVGHDGVVKVQDDGVTEDGCAFLVLDLLLGDTIEARRVRFGGALPIDEVLEIADQALDALGAAHEKGIVHRDVKPDNVFVCEGGKVKLLDFGLARMKDAQAETTQTGVAIGTPEFMPPEQAQGRRDEVDARSDVWGLGATLFTAITGQYVHDASTLHEQLIASATLRPRGIRELAPHVSPAVAVVIDRALELEKADRWDSAREMQRALRNARGTRRGADEYSSESLTLPAASLRRSEVPPSAPPVPSTEQTAPLTAEMLLDSLPSTLGPTSPAPRTERITGTRTAGAVLQAQSHAAQLQAAQLHAALADAALPGAHHPHVSRQSTLKSPQGPIVGVAPPAPPAPPHAAPPHAAPAPAAPLATPVRRKSSARTLVVVCVLLVVLASVAAGAWAYLHH